jgi:hypothetical protein
LEKERLKNQAWNSNLSWLFSCIPAGTTEFYATAHNLFLADSLIFRLVEKKHMKALLQVISLVVISVVVIINPPCGATLGERKA